MKVDLFSYSDGYFKVALIAFPLHFYCENVFITKELFKRLGQDYNKLILCPVTQLKIYGIKYDKKRRKIIEAKRHVTVEHIDNLISDKSDDVISENVKWLNIDSLSNQGIIWLKSAFAEQDLSWLSRVQSQLASKTVSSSVYNSHTNANNKPEEENGVKVRGIKAERR